MRIRVPPKKVREKFLLIYELEGCQEAVDFLTKHYRVRPMRIILNDRRVGNGYRCLLPEQGLLHKERIEQANSTA
jgi:hypothetical protein